MNKAKQLIESALYEDDYVNPESILDVDAYDIIRDAINGLDKLVDRNLLKDPLEKSLADLEGKLPEQDLESLKGKVKSLVKTLYDAQYKVNELFYGFGRLNKDLTKSIKRFK